jgi:hypothetical protein
VILPDKHIGLQHSLLGAGGAILAQVERPMTVSALWDAVRSAPEVHDYPRFVLALDFLFAIGVIDYTEGILSKRGTP